MELSRLLGVASKAAQTLKLMPNAGVHNLGLTQGCTACGRKALGDQLCGRAYVISVDPSLKKSFTLTRKNSIRTKT